MGYPSGVTSKPWGFEGVYFREKSDTVSLLRPLGSYVIENVRFNTTVPANVSTKIRGVLMLTTTEYGYFKSPTLVRSQSSSRRKIFQRAFQQVHQA